MTHAPYQVRQANAVKLQRIHINKMKRDHARVVDQLKVKHTKELQLFRKKVSELNEKLAELNEKLAEAQRKHKNIRLEAQVETLKAQLEAARRIAQRKSSPAATPQDTNQQKKQDVVTPVMPANQVTPRVTQQQNAVTPIQNAVTPLQNAVTPLSNNNNLTPYDPLMPNCVPPAPMSLQMVAQQLLQGRRTTRRQLPFRTPPLADPRSAYGGYGWVGY